MSNLIVSNPAAALAAAIPQDVRSELPEEVLAHSESRISGIGNLQVFGVTPEEGTESTAPLIQRQVQLGDQSYQAHTYGVLSRFGTVNDLYMHGVAVGDRIALADSPVRALEAGETVDVSLMADVAYDEARWAALGEEVSIAAAIGRAYENLGPKTMLLIPVEFPDRAGSPWSSTAVRDSRISNIQDYFSNASYGKFTLPNIITASLQLMDNNATYYAGDNYTTLRDHAVAKAITAVGNSTANYDFISIIINHNLYPSGAGLGQIGAKYSWIDGYNYGSELDQRSGVYIHELGHNLGLWHANSWDPTSLDSDDSSGTASEYGNRFDAMGDTWTYSYDQLHFNASFKNALSWLPDSCITTVTTNVTLNLYAMDRTQVNNRTYAVKIPRDFTLGGVSKLDYWVEFRSRYPTVTTIRDGVLIYTANPTHDDGASMLLDMTPSTQTALDSGLRINQSFTTADFRWKITVNSQSGSNDDSLINVTISKRLHTIGPPLSRQHCRWIP